MRLKGLPGAHTSACSSEVLSGLSLISLRVDVLKKSLDHVNETTNMGSRMAQCVLACQVLFATMAERLIVYVSFICNFYIMCCIIYLFISNYCLFMTECL